MHCLLDLVTITTRKGKKHLDLNKKNALPNEEEQIERALCPYHLLRTQLLTYEHLGRDDELLRRALFREPQRRLQRHNKRASRGEWEWEQMSAREWREVNEWWMREVTLVVGRGKPAMRPTQCGQAKPGFVETSTPTFPWSLTNSPIGVWRSLASRALHKNQTSQGYITEVWSRMT